MATVLMPWMDGCYHRQEAFKWVARRYEGAGFEYLLSASEENSRRREWCKARAILDGLPFCADTVILADADCWTDGIAAAVDAVEDGAIWAVPHGDVHRLTEKGTEAVLAGARWEDQRVEKSPYKGFEGGGILVARREVLEAVPVDVRFVGWGQEDECHAMALRTLFGAPWRGSAPLVHLWHPPQERLSRRRGSEESWALRQRYYAARKDPAAMKALLEESRN